MFGAPNVTYDEWHCSGKKKVLISSCRDVFATPEEPAEVLADYGWILDPEVLQLAPVHYIVSMAETIQLLATLILVVRVTTQLTIKLDYMLGSGGRVGPTLTNLFLYKYTFILITCTKPRYDEVSWNN